MTSPQGAERSLPLSHLSDIKRHEVHEVNVVSKTDKERKYTEEAIPLHTRFVEPDPHFCSMLLARHVLVFVIRSF